MTFPFHTFYGKNLAGWPWPGTFCGPLLLRLVPKDAGPGLQRPRGRGRRSQGDQHRVFQVADLRPRFAREEFTQNIREQNPKQSETIGDFFRILGMKRLGLSNFKAEVSKVLPCDFTHGDVTDGEMQQQSRRIESRLPGHPRSGEQLCIYKFQPIFAVKNHSRRWYPVPR